MREHTPRGALIRKNISKTSTDKNIQTYMISRSAQTLLANALALTLPEPF